MQQVHGSNVVRVDKDDDGKIIEDCDALISNDPEVTLSVRVADCLPISVIDRKSRSFGLIHAGWRGLSKGIIRKTIALMVGELKIGSEAGYLNWNLKINIGPHICQKHYEVKNDVSCKFTKLPGVILKQHGKEFLDLAKIAEIQLTDVGVKKENIKTDTRCTFEDRSLFSYRRNQTMNRNLLYLRPFGKFNKL